VEITPPHLTKSQGKSVSELRIGLESTNEYSFHPSMFLHNYEFNQALDGQVFVMNPKQIANFKNSYSDMDKADEIDAFVIVDYMRFGRLPMSVVKVEQYVALQQFVPLLDALLRKNLHAHKERQYMR